MRTGNEDQSLGDDGNLKVDNHVQLVVIVINSLTGGSVQADAELVLEERRVDDDSNKSDTVRNLLADVNELLQYSTYVDAVK